MAIFMAERRILELGHGVNPPESSKFLTERQEVMKTGE
jgi:hypothetical protein